MSVINGIDDEGVGCVELTTIAIRDGVGEIDRAVGIGVRCVGPSAVVVIGELT